MHRGKYFFTKLNNFVSPSFYQREINFLSQNTVFNMLLTVRHERKLELEREKRTEGLVERMMKVNHTRGERIREHSKI